MGLQLGLYLFLSPLFVFVLLLYKRSNERLLLACSLSESLWVAHKHIQKSIKLSYVMCLCKCCCCCCWIWIFWVEKKHNLNSRHRTNLSACCRFQTKEQLICFVFVRGTLKSCTNFDSILRQSEILTCKLLLMLQSECSMMKHKSHS